MNSIKLIFSAVLLSLISTYCWSQKAPFKMGRIDETELSTTVDDKFPEASAVVLGDFGTTSFEYNQIKGWQYVIERQVRIKIYNKDGLDQANISIPFYDGEHGNREDISGLKAYTYNLVDGKEEREKMDKDAIFEEQLSENWFLQKFTLPQVKVGSIIEYSYSLRSDYVSNLHTWEFQKEIPVKHSEYRITIPQYFNYQKSYKGYEKLGINESTYVSESFRIEYTTGPQEGGKVERGEYEIESNSTKSRWVANNLPGISKEPYMTAPSDYFAQMGFQLISIQYPRQGVDVVMGTYEGEFNNGFMESDRFGGLLDKTRFADDLVNKIIAGAGSEEEKLVKIYEYVKQYMTWNDSHRLYAIKNLKNIHKDKSGSVADINLLLVGLLRKAGINANPIVLSTRSNGKPHPVYPSLNEYNYVIGVAFINNNQYLMDATAKSLPVNVLPEKALNGKGWMVSESPGWITLEGNSGLEKSVSVKARFSEDYFNADVEVKKSGLTGAVARSNYLNDGEDDYKNKTVTSLGEWEIVNADYENEKDIYSSFNEKLKLQLQTQTNASIMYIDPVIIGGLKENWFKNERRKFPVDFPAGIKQTYYLQLEIPEGYKVEELPENSLLALPGQSASFKYSVTHSGSNIILISQLEIKKTLFAPTEYAGLRKFLDLIVSKHNEQIVIKKM